MLSLFCSVCSGNGDGILLIAGSIGGGNLCKSVIIFEFQLLSLGSGDDNLRLREIVSFYQ